MAKEEIDFKKTDDTLLITLGDKFDYHHGKRFQDACRAHTGINKYIIDFKHVSYIDSSALGRLMFLRTQAGEEQADITIINPRKAIFDILKITQLHKVFKIKDII
ncbi:MAG: STAS domain-containing protein [Magnetococcales bacterium]|nr:STAS domain-containing protein [Magnetococcales bacterium]